MIFGLGDFLNAINKTKEDLFERVTESGQLKDYQQFVINRCLAAHIDSIMLVNELNCCCATLSNRSHFDTLRLGLPQRSRYAKLPKEQKNATIDLLVKLNTCSRRRAEELVDVLKEEDIEKLKRFQSFIS